MNQVQMTRLLQLIGEQQVQIALMGDEIAAKNRMIDQLQQLVVNRDPAPEVAEIQDHMAVN